MYDLVAIYFDDVYHYLTFVTRGTPRQKRNRERQTVKSLLCLRSWSGQLSTIPVTRASTLQNSESIPRTSNITKKMVAHSTEPGRDKTWNNMYEYI